MTDQHPPTPNAGWYRDPTGVGDARYWDGQAWTDSVSRQGTTVQIPPEPAQRHVPPVPGTEYRAGPAAAPAPAPPPTVQITQTSPSRRSPVGGIVAAFLGIAVVVLIVVIAIQSSDGDDEDTPTDQTEQEVTGDAPEPDSAPEEPEVPVDDASSSG